MTAGRRRWLAGAPAMAALVVGPCVMAYLYAGSAAARTGWYADAADTAFDAGDFRTAAVCYNRVRQARPGDPAVLFNLARSLDAIGQPDAARSLLLRLAPADKPGGYPPAHLRLVRQLLSGDHPAPGDLDAAARHLTPIARDQPADPEVNFWLAVLAADRGQWDLVPGAAKSASSMADLLAPRLAAIGKAQGNAEQADRWSHATGG